MHKKTKIVAGVVTAVCAVTIVFFAGALYMLSQKKEALSISVAQIATARARESELAALARLVDSTQSERVELHTRVLGEEGVIDFLSLIETLAKEQGVVLITKALTVEDAPPSFESLKVTLSLSGSNDALLHVLEILEVLPYQASVVSATVTNSGAGSEDEWTADVELIVTKLKKI